MQNSMILTKKIVEEYNNYRLDKLSKCTIYDSNDNIIMEEKYKITKRARKTLSSKFINNIHTERRYTVTEMDTSGNVIYNTTAVENITNDIYGETISNMNIEVTIYDYEKIPNSGIYEYRLKNITTLSDDLIFQPPLNFIEMTTLNNNYIKRGTGTIIYNKSYTYTDYNKYIQDPTILDS